MRHLLQRVGEANLPLVGIDFLSRVHPSDYQGYCTLPESFSQDRQDGERQREPWKLREAHAREGPDGGYLLRSFLHDDVVAQRQPNRNRMRSHCFPPVSATEYML